MVKTDKSSVSNWAVVHDNISEVVKATSWTTRFILFQISRL